MKNRLKVLRAERDWTQGDVAERRGRDGLLAGRGGVGSDDHAGDIGSL